MSDDDRGGIGNHGWKLESLVEGSWKGCQGPVCGICSWKRGASWDVCLLVW